MKTSLKQLRLRQLDERTSPFRDREHATPPRGGWLRAVRTSLGMSASQFAFRLGVTRQAVADQERREVDGTTTLASLRKAADAMECDVFYAIVPRRPLGEMVRLRAREVAEHRLRGIAHSMGLEEQSVPHQEFERQVDDLADQIVRELPRDLWSLVQR
ncbi:MAG: mobile mystery protein A [Gemmatimonadales bacterium]